MASEDLKYSVSTTFMTLLRCFCVIYEAFCAKERKRLLQNLNLYSAVIPFWGWENNAKDKGYKEKKAEGLIFTLDTWFTSIHDLREVLCKRWYFIMFFSFIIILALLGINQRGVIEKMRFKWVEGMFSRSLSVLLLKVGYMLLSVTIKLQLSAVWR